MSLLHTLQRRSKVPPSARSSPLETLLRQRDLYHQHHTAIINCIPMGSHLARRRKLTAGYDIHFLDNTSDCTPLRGTASCHSRRGEAKCRKATPPSNSSNCSCVRRQKNAACHAFFEVAKLEKVYAVRSKCPTHLNSRFKTHRALRFEKAVMADGLRVMPRQRNAK